MKKILFICMGNICRSAMAEGILRHKIQSHNLPVVVDSAGTHKYHNGEQYDRRAREILHNKNIDVDDLKSRRIHSDDFTEFDVLFAADNHNRNYLLSEFGEISDKVQLMTAYSVDYHNQEVPDPYYGGEDGFEQVYQMLAESIEQWLKHEGYLS